MYWNFFGGSLSNGTIIGNNSTIAGEYSGFFKRGLKVIGTWTNDTFYIDWFEYYGDNVAWL